VPLAAKKPNGQPPAKVNDIRCPGSAEEIASLVPDPMNARLHPERNTSAIMASLAKHGQLKPIVVRVEDRVVAAGNGTMEAARRLGWTRIAANVRSMTDEEFRSYALADNRTAELAEWDAEIVKVLAALQVDCGGAVIGFSPAELEALSDALNGMAPPPTLVSDGDPQVWEELWKGMPEFLQDDQTSFRRVAVHFRSQEDFEEFLRLVGQRPGDVRQNSIWFPKAEIGRFAGKSWGEGE
jgi:hypothetical protein